MAKTEALAAQDPAGPAPPGTTPVDDQAQERLLALFKNANNGDRVLPPAYTDVRDWLPNVEFRSRGGAQPLYDAVIRGKVVDVKPGAAFRQLDEEDDYKQVRVDFDDKRIDFANAVLVVDVLEQLGPGRSVGDQVRVGLSISSASDVEVLRDGFLQMESVVLALNNTPGIFDYEPDLFDIEGYDLRLIEVRNGRLSLPEVAARAPALEAKLLAATPTLGELKSEAAKPKRVRDFPAGRSDLRPPQS